MTQEKREAFDDSGPQFEFLYLLEDLLLALQLLQLVELQRLPLLLLLLQLLQNGKKIERVSPFVNS